MRRSLQVTGILAFAVSLIGIYAVADDPGPISPEEEGFRLALEGDFSQVPQNGIYSDVVGVIKDRGSLLDGTSFDLKADVDEERRTTVSISKKAYAAEQILKASRWLESIDSDDPDRVELVNRMRAEAVKLLSE
jgi:hypothetical protein